MGGFWLGRSVLQSSVVSEIGLRENLVVRPSLKVMV